MAVVEDDNWLQSHHWPHEFFNTHRLFSRHEENKPYIEWLHALFNYSEEDGDESTADDDFDDSNEDEDEIDWQEDMSEEGDENGISIVRTFMTGMTGDEETLQYANQIERVAGFCEQSSIRESEKHVVLLDDRRNSGTIYEKPAYSRLYQGPLTSQQLREKLSKQVPKIYSHTSLEKFTHYIAFQSRVKPNECSQRI
jgi:hypothetical protein